MTIESTLKERGERYGDFADHAKIAQALQDVARGAEGWVRMDAVQRQALTVICDKIARILSGDPTYADNWHDIQGYAKLVEDRLPKPEKANEGLSLPVVELPASMRCGDAIHVPPLEVPRPWYPDNGGWVEVPGSDHEMPGELQGWRVVEILRNAERKNKCFEPFALSACDYEWDLPICDPGRIVAYKVV